MKRLYFIVTAILFLGILSGPMVGCQAQPVPPTPSTMPSSPPTPGSSPSGTETITFPDSNLEAAIRNALGKPEGEEMMAAELAGLTELCSSSRSIADISGLEYCTGPPLLALSGNHASDISPLSQLTNLMWLDLSGN